MCPRPRAMAGQQLSAVVLLSLLCLRLGSTQQPWPQYRGNSQRNGLSWLTDGPSSSSAVEVKWNSTSFRGAQSLAPLTALVTNVVTGGSESTAGVYLTTGTGYTAMLAAGASDGAPRWSALAGPSQLSTPTLSLDGSALYVPNAQFMYIYHPHNGTLRTVYGLECPVNFAPLVTSPYSSPFRPEGELVIACSVPYQSIQRAYWDTASTFKAAWKVNNLLPSVCAPSLSSDGSTIWICPTDTSTIGSPTTLTGLWASDGNVRYTTTITGVRVRGPIAIHPSTGHLFVTTTDGKLRSYSDAGGFRFSVDVALPAVQVAPLAIGMRNLTSWYVYALTAECKMYIVNAETGAYGWQQLPGYTASSATAGPLSSPLVGKGGSVYVAWEPVAGSTGAITRLAPHPTDTYLSVAAWTMPLSSTVKSELAFSDQGELVVALYGSTLSAEVMAIGNPTPPPPAPVSNNKGLLPQRNGASYYRGPANPSAGTITYYNSIKWSYLHPTAPFLFAQPLVSSDSSRAYLADYQGNIVVLNARNGALALFNDIPAAVNASLRSVIPRWPASGSHPCLRENILDAQRLLMYSPRNSLYAMNVTAGVEYLPDQRWMTRSPYGQTISGGNFSSPLCLPQGGVPADGRTFLVVQGQSSVFCFKDQWSSQAWGVAPGGDFLDSDEVGGTATPDESVIVIVSKGSTALMQTGAVLFLNASTGVKFLPTLAYTPEIIVNSVATAWDYSEMSPAAAAALSTWPVSATISIIKNSATRMVTPRGRPSEMVHTFVYIPIAGQSSSGRTDNPRLEAYNSKDGFTTCVWRFQPSISDSGYIATPSVDGPRQRLYVAVIGRGFPADLSSGGAIYVLNATTGIRLTWIQMFYNSMVPPYGAPFIKVHSPTISTDGLIYYTSAQNVVKGARLLEATDVEGTTSYALETIWAWTGPSNDVFFSAPVILPDGGLLVSGYTSSVGTYMGKVVYIGEPLPSVSPSTSASPSSSASVTASASASTSPSPSVSPSVSASSSASASVSATLTMSVFSFSSTNTALSTPSASRSAIFPSASASSFPSASASSFPSDTATPTQSPTATVTRIMPSPTPPYPTFAPSTNKGLNPQRNGRSHFVGPADVNVPPSTAMFTTSTRWTYTHPLARDDPYLFTQPLIPVDGRRVYVSSWRGNLTAIDSSTGAGIWTTRPLLSAIQSGRITDYTDTSEGTNAQPCLREKRVNYTLPAALFFPDQFIVSSSGPYALALNASESSFMDRPPVYNVHVSASGQNLSNPLCLQRNDLSLSMGYPLGATTVVWDRNGTTVRRLNDRYLGRSWLEAGPGSYSYLDEDGVGPTASPDERFLFVPGIGDGNPRTGLVNVLAIGDGYVVASFSYLLGRPCNSIASDWDYSTPPFDTTINASVATGNSTSYQLVTWSSRLVMAFVPLAIPLGLSSGDQLAVEARRSDDWSRVLWRSYIEQGSPNLYISTPSIDGPRQRLYVAAIGETSFTLGGVVVVMNSTTGAYLGNIRLRFTRLQPFGVPFLRVQSPTVAADGIIYVTTADREVNAWRLSSTGSFGRTTFENIWTFRGAADDYFFSSPVITSDGGLVVNGFSSKYSFEEGSDVTEGKVIFIGQPLVSASPSPYATPSPSGSAPAPASVAGISEYSASATPSAPRTPRPSVSPFVSCVDLGFTDPSIPDACTNASHPLFARCAFGSAPDCRPCPKDRDGNPVAACPGGSRAWPLAGYYSVSETSYDIFPCAAPATARCVGWDATAGSIACGERYTGLKCLSCRKGYYHSSSGSSASASSASSASAASSPWGDCIACPSSIISDASAIVVILRNAAIFLGIAVGVALFVLALSFTVSKVLGGSVTGARSRLLELFLWIITILQLLAQAGKTAAPGLPPTMAAIFSSLDIFQFGGPALSPAECLDSYAFTNEVSLMGVALFVYLGLVLLVAAVEVGWCAPRQDNAGSRKAGFTFAAYCPPALLGFLPWLLFNASFLLFAPATNAAFALLSCQEVTMTGSQKAALDQDDWDRAMSIVLGSWEEADALTKASVLTSRPSFMCFSGAHRPAGVLAAFTVGLMVVPFPFWLWAWVSARAKAIALTAASKEDEQSESSESEEEEQEADQRVTKTASKRIAGRNPAYLLPTPALSASSYSHFLALRQQDGGRGSWKVVFGERRRSTFAFLSTLSARASAAPPPKKRPGSVLATGVLPSSASSASLVGNPLVLLPSNGPPISPTASRPSVSPTVYSNPLRGNASPDDSSASCSSPAASVKTVEGSAIPLPSPNAGGGPGQLATLPKPLLRAYSQRRQHSKMVLLPLSPSPSSLSLTSSSPSVASSPPTNETAKSSSAPLDSGSSSIAGVIDASKAVNEDIMLASFTPLKGGFRASTPFVRPLELLLLAFLACIQALWVVDSSLKPLGSASAGGITVSVTAVGLRGFFICLALLFVAWYYWTRRPFPVEERWKLNIKVGSLLVTALSFVLVDVSLASDGSSNSLDAVAGLGYAVVAACVILFLALGINFFRAIFQGAAKEKQELALKAARRKLRREERRARAARGTSVEQRRNMSRRLKSTSADSASPPAEAADEAADQKNGPDVPVYYDRSVRRLSARHLAVARAVIAPSPTGQTGLSRVGASTGNFNTTRIVITDFDKERNRASSADSSSSTSSSASSSSSSSSLAVSTLGGIVARARKSLSRSGDATSAGSSASSRSHSAGVTGAAKEVLARVRRVSGDVFSSSSRFAPRTVGSAASSRTVALRTGNSNGFLRQHSAMLELQQTQRRLAQQQQQQQPSASGAPAAALASTISSLTSAAMALRK